MKLRVFQLKNTTKILTLGFFYCFFMRMVHSFRFYLFIKKKNSQNHKKKKKKKQEKHKKNPKKPQKTRKIPKNPKKMTKNDEKTPLKNRHLRRPERLLRLC
jgi:hypothetical protein